MVASLYTGPGGRAVTDCIDLDGNAQGTLSVSATFAQSSALSEGVYDVWCDTDVYIGVGTDKTGMTTGTGYLLRVGNVLPLMVRDQRKIAGITSSASGTLSYHKVL